MSPDDPVPRPQGGERLFATLADPTRRAIVEMLVRNGPDTATNLASQLAISRQATAKHLDRLAETGLAVPRRVGRETRYTVNPRPLDNVTSWITTVQGQWTARLERLRSSLDNADLGGPAAPDD